MEIRKITQAEKVKFLECHTSAVSDFSDEQITEAQASWISSDEAFAVFINGNIVSTLRNITFKQVVRNVLKKMGGIAGVATLPEYRLRGYTKALIKAAFLDMRAKGQAVSALHPFKESFYAAYGYVTTNSWIDIKIPSYAFTHYLDLVKEMDSDWQITRVKAVDVKAEVLSFLLQLSNLPHGLVIDPDRSDLVWQNWHENSLVVFVKKNGKPQAIAKYTKKGNHDGEIFIREMYWQNLNARDKLFGFFALQKDNFPGIWLRLPFGTNFYPWLRDSMLQFETEIYYSPMMVRVMDVEIALDNLPTSVEGEISFTLQDRHCAWNNGDYLVISQAGKLKVKKTNLNSKLKMSIEGISALVYGALSIEEVAHRSWITGLDEKTTVILQRWFPPITAYNPYYF